MDAEGRGKRIGILGCGWLGFPLCRRLEKEGWQVKVSTTSRRKRSILKARGIDAYLVEFTPDLGSSSEKDFFKVDILVISIPPPRRPDVEKYHQEQVKSLVEALTPTPVKRILFISSTSVYPTINGEVDEEEKRPPERPVGIALKKVEKRIQAQSSFKTTILRLAGLIGYDRVPGRFLRRKKEMMAPDAPLNLIHRDDAISLICRIISQEAWGKIYNGSAPIHPTRREFYTTGSRQPMTVPPIFEDKTVRPRFKIVSGEKAVRELGFTYRYPDPLDLMKRASFEKREKVSL